MIFIALVIFIVIVIVSLNFYDSYNIEKIEKYLNQNHCKELIYSKGSYKALCEDRFLEVPNGFSVDESFVKEKQVSVKYIDIKTIKELKNMIIIDDKKINFNNEDERNKFYNSLKEELKDRNKITNERSN